MSAQLQMIYSARFAGHEIWQRQLEVVRSAVNYLSLKEVAYELDVSGSLLCDALNERDRKGWRIEWVHIVKAMLAKKAGDEIAHTLLRQLVDLDLEITGFTIANDENEEDDELAAAAAAAALALKRNRKRPAPR